MYHASPPAPNPFMHGGRYTGILDIRSEPHCGTPNVRGYKTAPFSRRLPPPCRSPHSGACVYLGHVRDSDLLNGFCGVVGTGSPDAPKLFGFRIAGQLQYAPIGYRVDAPWSTDQPGTRVIGNSMLYEKSPAFNLCTSPVCQTGPPSSCPL